MSAACRADQRPNRPRAVLRVAGAALAAWYLNRPTVDAHSLVLYGTTQRLKLEPWEPETTRTMSAPFAWKPDTWYRLKLRVENLANGEVRARGKAWPVGEAEPAAWMIDKTDPIGNREGAPGFFIDAQFGTYIDNLSLYQNQP